MKTIIVKDLNEASSNCFKFIDEELSKTSSKINIALTGGRFGKFFASEIAKRELPYSRIRFFQTDERIVSFLDKECIQRMILEELSSADNLETFFFNLDQTASESGNEMDARINKYKIDKLDVVILSLGEDGHLAGNFYNSRSINDRITYTNSSPKPPEKRISFSVEWLVQSNVVIIVALGIEKCSAINDLYQKKNGFSDLISKSENIFLLTDQSVSSDIN